jgi:hypothetical protein
MGLARLFPHTEFEEYMGSSYQKDGSGFAERSGTDTSAERSSIPATNQPKPAVAQVILGLKSEMSKSQAREKLEGEIAEAGKTATQWRQIHDQWSCHLWMVRTHRYLPLKEADWREETAKVKKHIIQADLVDEFGDDPIRKLRQVHSANPPQQAGQDSFEG